MLTVTAVKQAKPKEKSYKLYDQLGLFLVVKPSGRKYWHFKYKFNGKNKLLSIGPYPTVSLKEAREERDRLRKFLAKGIDPSLARKQNMLQGNGGQNSFKEVALEWFERQKNVWAKSHADKVLGRLNNHVFPWLGDRQISTITPVELLDVLRRIESRGTIETAHRVKQICGQIFRYAIGTGRAERDITADLRGILTPYRSKSMPTITDPEKIGELMRAIYGYKGYFVVTIALKFIPLVFVRHKELRYAEWKEINWTRKEWKIPSEKMKIKRPHIVPLSRQACELLEELRPYTEPQSRYLFPSPRTNERPISDNTLLAALRRLGFSREEFVIHGFRSMASTILNENGWPPDAIERQLAHIEGNSVRAAYNYAEYLETRHNMMQWWADFLDAVRLQTALPPKRTKTV